MKTRKSLPEVISALIVRWRVVITVFFALLCVLCFFGLKLTRTNADFTRFLPAETDTARGVRLMEEEFPALPRAQDQGEDNQSYSERLAKEMIGVVLVSVTVILLVLLVTSTGFFDLVVYLIVFSVSALINMGTYFLMGTISTITNTVAMILQLALSIDYAIIFMKRFQEGREKEGDASCAAVYALKLAIREVAASSLTTVSGLCALVLMHFKFGADLGFALAKGVLCSMLTVFLLMPALVVFFDRYLQATRHKSFVPSVYKITRRMCGAKPVILPLIVAVVAVFAVLSYQASFVFNGANVSPLGVGRLKEKTVKDTTLAVIIPAGMEEEEYTFSRRAGALENVTSVVSYAGLMDTAGEKQLLPGSDAKGGVSMYTPCTAEELAQALGQNVEVIRLLYTASATEQGQGADAAFRMTPEEALSYLFAHKDHFLIRQLLGEALAAQLDGAEEMVCLARVQLVAQKHHRILVLSSARPDTPQGEELLMALRQLSQETFGADVALICGDITSAYELKDTFEPDRLRVSFLTAAFVFIILLATFRNPLLALEMVMVIQSSIWINFGCTYVFSQRPLFITQMIGTAIQMGATVDYAIVLVSRYRMLRKSMDAAEAAARCADKAFATVMTSGLIMGAAGLLIAGMVSDPYVSHIGLIVGRGALISIVLVLAVLPQLLKWSDRAILRLDEWYQKRFNKRHRVSAGVDQ